jgi:ABC-type transport system substrate-binding protein
VRRWRAPFQRQVSVQLDFVDVGLARRLAGEGKLQSWTELRPMGVYPDTGNHLGTYFRGAFAAYFGDKVISDALDQADVEFDMEKRTQIYGKILDRTNEMSYALPVAGVPTSWIHSKDVRIETNTISAGENFAIDFAWN